jgi:2-keto-4-pentenoate hydratase/2-oxohepta-3-ene-1,7-dioic acid hydratase in catechol pathway
MRLATIVDDGALSAAVVEAGRVLSLPVGETGVASVRDIASSGPAGLARVRAFVERQPAGVWRGLDQVELGPAVPDPGAIYTIGLNYRAPDEPSGVGGPARPLVYGKAPNSVAGHGGTLDWDRTVTDDVDAEVELGVVIGEPAWRVAPDDAMRHVFGYTCMNDVSSRDEWLDGDQWLLGKSMPGFCPVGPWVVTSDELDPADLRLRCTINGIDIQDDRTARLRFGIPAIVSYLSRHVALRPGDLIATGTPVRLTGGYGPERRLRPGDVVTVSIEGIGDLTTHIAPTEEDQP